MPASPDLNSGRLLGKNQIWKLFMYKFGGGEIRTHETLSRLHAFQACSIGHSDTPPGRWGIYAKSVLFLNVKILGAYNSGDCYNVRLNGAVYAYQTHFSCFALFEPGGM